MTVFDFKQRNLVMKFFALAFAAVQGLFVVGGLALIQAIVQAFSPEWSLPFSVWWGLSASLPGIAMAAFFANNRL